MPNQWTGAADTRGRFDRLQDRSAACWLWTAAVHRNGYGLFSVKVGARWEKRWAHRVAYELYIRPLKAGETVDHLCMNTRCVNPAHLNACPIGENSRRSPNTLQGANARKTHCPKGHPYAGDNLFYDQGKRRCRICTNAKNRAARVRRQAQKHGASPPA